MDQSPDIYQLLERLTYPTIIVKAGVVTYANALAQQHMIMPNAPVSPLITAGEEEYSEFCSGSICLTLTVLGHNYDTTVVRNEDYDIFYLESEANSPELKAFALAAQHLRAPLSSALHCADLLQSDTSESGQAQLERLNRNLHQLHRTLCNMSDAGNIEYFRSTMKHYCDLTAVLAELLEKTSQLLKHSDRKLIYNLPSESISINLDVEKVERAVYNLISNAVQYSPKGSSICVTLHRNKKTAFITIENEISHPVPNNIFSKFQREPGIELGYTGLGFGLTIARKAAIAHNGTLLMDHTEDGHQRFTISLAIKQSQELEVRSPILLPIDYAGGYDHALLELSDILPPELYAL